ncbi:MAG: PfkB family carbohydrate kinase [Anaeromyxobacter sp.]
MPSAHRTLRLAVVGHVEHITLGRVPAPPAPGDIAHLEHPFSFPGGGGGVALLQLAKSPAEVHVFTAIGSGEAGREVEAGLADLGVIVHAARREEPHTRDLVLVNPDGERTILVVGEPLHPRREDPLPWELLAACDAVYFTAQDPAVLRACRAARLLALTARRRDALTASGVRADLVLGSAHDPREAWALAEYAVRPGAVVLTEGARGGVIATAAGAERFPAPPPPRITGAAYGCGDSFAAATVFYLAAGLPLREACTRAGPHGAAILTGLDPRKTQLPLALP